MYHMIITDAQTGKKTQQVPPRMVIVNGVEVPESGMEYMERMLAYERHDYAVKIGKAWNGGF